jgi:hypothetical protein
MGGLLGPLVVMLVDAGRSALLYRQLRGCFNTKSPSSSSTTWHSHFASSLHLTCRRARGSTRIPYGSPTRRTTSTTIRDPYRDERSRRMGTTNW